MATEKETDNQNKSIIIEIPTDLEYQIWSKCSIQRVPKKLRKVNESAYSPHLLSIGPFHHGKPDLIPMESHKRQYHQQFLNRTRKKNTQLKRFIHSHHQEILSSYAGTVEFPKETFLEIVLVDACFILELFLRNSEGRDDDYILQTPWLRRDVEIDLILFENQIPFVFLKKLYDFVALIPEISTAAELETEQQPEKTRMELFPLLSESSSSSWFSHPLIVHSKRFFSFSSEDENMERVKHFTDMIRGNMIMSPKKAADSGNRISFLYSARRLETAGIGLVPRMGESRVAEIELVPGMLDSVFCGGCVPCLPSMKLEMPELVVQDETECVFRNVMALEQCVYPYQAHICSYVLFLDQLVDTAEDVDLLVRKKVVKNLLGSNDVVAKLINKLCDQIVETNSCYYGISERLNGYCDNCCNSTKATIKRTYFKDCWTASTALFGFCVTAFSVTSIVRGLFFR